MPSANVVATSRLDRLIALLESGSTAAVKSTAARQLGQVAALRVRGHDAQAAPAPRTAASGSTASASDSADTAHVPSLGVRQLSGTSTPLENELVIKKEDPELSLNASAADARADSEVYRGTEGEWNEAVNLLAKVLPYLRSRSWEARVAAAQAIEAICSASGVWDPEAAANQSVEDAKDDTAADPSQHPSADLLTFRSFSLTHILTTGTKLLSSTGREYELPTGSLAERLARAKADMSKLGLGVGNMDMDIGMDVEAELRQGEESAGLGGAEGSDKASVTSTNDLPPPRFAPKPAPTALPPPRFAADTSISPTLPPPRFGAVSSAHERRSSESELSEPHSLAEDAPSTEPVSPDTSEAPGGDEEMVDVSKLSARERNQLKRKRKMAGGSSGLGLGSSKTRVIESSSANSASGALRIKTSAWNGPGAGGPASSRTPITPMPMTPATPATPGGAGKAGDYLSAKQVPPTPKWPAAGTGVPPAHARSEESPTPLVPSSKPIQQPSLVASPVDWPFRHVVELLSVDLFDAMWEVRHGAALALREILSIQGVSGGKSLDRSLESNAVAHQAWCDDIAIKLLCVLALDRLGDFVFDHVVAPVRETASQTLATLLPFMQRSSVEKVHRVFLEMIAQDNVAQGSAEASLTNLGAHRGNKGYAWEVRHAGFLGLRYEVLARADMLFDEKAAHDVKQEVDDAKDAVLRQPSALLRDIVHVSILALRDEDDDVRAAAAAALQPLAESIVRYLPDELSRLIDQVWDCLGDSKDDLSSSIGGVMDVLSRLVAQDAVIQLLNAGSEDRSLSALIPRLYPFFRHTITSVRVSVLNMLRVFLTVPSISQDWIDARILRLLFQNLIVEERSAVRSASLEVWTLTLHSCASDERRLADFLQPHLGAFFSIIMTLLGSPIEYSLFFTASSTAGASTHNIDKAALAQDLTLVGVDVVIRNRLGAAKALGQALAKWPRADEVTAFSSYLSTYLASSSALQRCLAAVIVQEWADAHDDAERGPLVQSSVAAADVLSQLCAMLEAPVPTTYSEMVAALHRIQHECQGLYTALSRDAKVPKTAVPLLPTTVDPLGQLEDAFNIDTAADVAGVHYPALVARIPVKLQAKMLPALRERHMKLVASVGFYKSIKDKQDTQVYAAVASAVIALRTLPAKLNPVIRSIMNSVKGEENADLQARSASAVASFIALCHQSPERTNPSDKIVKNLSAFVCQDTTQTAIFADQKEIKEGILSMGDAVSSKTGRQPKEEVIESEDERKGKLLRRGAEVTLARIAQRFGERIFDITPVLWDSMSARLLDTFGESISHADALLAEAEERGQEVIDCLTALFVVGPSLHATLHPRVFALLPALSNAARSNFAVIRSAAARCFAQLAVALTSETLRHIVEHVLPYLGDASNVIHRQGAIEVVSLVVKQLDIALLPYIIFFVVPVLGRMSDSDEKVRLNATHTFAALIKMVPLEVGFPDPPGFSDELIQRRDEERKFLTQLLSGTKVEPYTIPVAINAQLRSYQEKGVSWMAFLCRYRLHGILCDDMGLGKTLQSICILASKHFERSERWAKTKSPDSSHLPSLIVCPPTLTHHWRQEIARYATNLSAMLYTGPTRASTVSQFASHDVVITSYDTVRMDVDILSSKNWFFCVLDEGHVIKNSKTKTTKAIKALRADHRLVLTGTPIQNNVLELWSLFDFLMPGFLGSERIFYERYGKPIVATRDGKVTSKEAEAATLALDSLHKQVLPFILRRLKEDALADLPPKIIQDVECDLGDLQRQLYEDFGRSQDRTTFEAAFDGSKSSNGGGQVSQDEAPGPEKHQAFAMMQYLRKLVCHPALIFDPSNPRHQEIALSMTRKGMALHDIAHSPKLQTLKQLLNDCGIGNGPTAAAGNASAEADLVMGAAEGAVSQHRVLVFCQMKQMLDIIENDLFRTHMPSVSYLRLDGNVPADKRHGIVETFNGDPSIDVLLLTTQVGGLGLTLTGADTVIFVEHDWNPMKDLQAMDRAHRLGQKKVVNVYRLITRNTLEAKIMGLQRFKLNVANSVVTQQNSGDSVASDQILDLFDTSAGPGGSASGAAATNKSTKGGISQKALLESLQNMPDVEEDEYKDLQDWTPGY